MNPLLAHVERVGVLLLPTTEGIDMTRQEQINENTRKAAQAYVAQWEHNNRLTARGLRGDFDDMGNDRIEEQYRGSQKRKNTQF